MVLAFPRFSPVPSGACAHACVTGRPGLTGVDSWVGKLGSVSGEAAEREHNSLLPCAPQRTGLCILDMAFQRVAPTLLRPKAKRGEGVSITAMSYGLKTLLPVAAGLAVGLVACLRHLGMWCLPVGRRLRRGGGRCGCGVARSRSFPGLRARSLGRVHDFDAVGDFSRLAQHDRGRAVLFLG